MSYRRVALAGVPLAFTAALAVNACSDDNVVTPTPDAGTGTFEAGPAEASSPADTSTPDAADAAVCTAGAYDWATSGAGTTDGVTGVAVDADGSVWISGTFIGSVKWGTFTLTDPDAVHTTGFVAKLDPKGTVLFATALHSSGAVNVGATAQRVRLDAQGDAYVTGTFFTELKLGTTVDLLQMNGGGAGAAYVVKFDKSGNPLWGLSTVNPGGTETAFDVAIDTNGDVYYTGNYGGQVEFVTPGDAGVATIKVANSGNGVFLAKWSQTDKKYVWAKGWSGNDVAGDFGGIGHAIAISSDGVTVVGDIVAQLNVEGTVFGAPLTMEAGSFLIKTDKSDGHVLWSTQIANKNLVEARLNGAVADAAGNLYVTGFFQGTATLESAASVDDAGADAATGSLMVTSTGTGRDMLVAKYSPSGAPLWVKHAGTGDVNARGNDVALDGTGGVYVTGFKQGDAVFDSKTLGGAGSGTLFIAKYDTSGVISFVQGNVNNMHEGGEGKAIWVGASGIVVGGTYDIDTTLGTIKLTSTATEGFVSRLCN